MATKKWTQRAYNAMEPKEVNKNKTSKTDKNGIQEVRSVNCKVFAYNNITQVIKPYFFCGNVKII